MEKDCCHDLEELRKDYEILKVKYSLPEFDGLAEDFDIEKVIEKESSFLLRDIRRAIREKCGAYLQLFEGLMNPASPPMFVFSLLKNANEDDKKLIKEIYKKLAKNAVAALKIDAIYSEKAEAEFIKTTSDEWQVVKKQIKDLFDKLDKDFDEVGSKVSGYFG